MPVGFKLPKKTTLFFQETEDESPLEIFEELPAETAQLSGNDDVNVGNAGEGGERGCRTRVSGWK